MNGCLQFTAGLMLFVAVAVFCVYIAGGPLGLVLAVAAAFVGWQIDKAFD